MKKLLALALLLFVVACSPPTAPSDVYRFVWSAAQGCSPGAMPPPSTHVGYPTVTVVVGDGSVRAAWLSGLTVEFKPVSSSYWVCKILAEGK